MKNLFLILLALSLGSQTLAMEFEEFHDEDVEEFIPPNLPTARPPCLGPDLALTPLRDPEWSATTRQSLILVTIKNSGFAPVTGPIDVRFFEGGRAIYQRIDGLAAGKKKSVLFRVDGWIFDPDAEYKVTLDPSNRVRECREDNNAAVYFKLG